MSENRKENGLEEGDVRMIDGLRNLKSKKADKS